jgi:hypothetical protein
MVPRQDSVEQWRADVLQRAGVAGPVARALARDLRYDLHALVALLESGCPPATAMRIAAPDDAALLGTMAAPPAGPRWTP